MIVSALLSLAIGGSVTLPPDASHLTVRASGERLTRTFDPQPDGCWRTWDFTFPGSRRILAQQTLCWGNEVASFAPIGVGRITLSYRHA